MSVEVCGAARGGGWGSFPLWADVQKLCNVCVLSLSWNFFVSHDKYSARPSSKEPRLYTENKAYNRSMFTPDTPLAEMDTGNSV